MAEKNLEDIQSFPILTTEVGNTARPATSGITSGTSLGQIIESSLREVLGWRPRASDPKGFLAALNQAFSLKETEGHTEWAWIQRSYAVQQDMGAVTGAQASIYARAKAALDQSLPLLEGLTPLRADADREDNDAVRAIVRSRLTELVYELGQVGGPRVGRVDDLFRSLLGATLVPADPAGTVSGLFGQMREEFGFERNSVNTIEEEQDLTNFVILVDQVVALHGTWVAQRPFFEGAPGTNVFLGTQLVLLSRALAVVAESVQETYFVMDSVFLGSAERQTTPLPGGVKLTVAELLGWVEHFASDEAPRVIREGGKDGVITLQPTVETLSALVNAILDDDTPSGGTSRQARLNPTPGFHTPRVQRALRELHVNLQETGKLFNQIKRLPPPEVTWVYPGEGSDSETAKLVNLHGKNFSDTLSMKVTLEQAKQNPINGTIKETTDSWMEVCFDLSQKPCGYWNVVVKTPGGTTQLQNGFKVNGYGVSGTAQALIPDPKPKK